MIPVQSKLLLAFGNPTQPGVVVPSGVEIILYDQVFSTVLVQYTDDIIAKLSKNYGSMANYPAKFFEGIPIFNRELTLPSDIVQRAFVAGDRLPDFGIKPNPGPFERKISGIYSPGPASLVFPEEYVVIVSGMDSELTTKLQPATRFSEMLEVLKQLPTPGRMTLRIYLMMVGY